MSSHPTLHAQIHTHGPHCGHAVIEHRDHGDETHPAHCTPSHDCGAHAVDHEHGPGCAHAAVPHGDHVDYVVDGHLHHPCDKHCDDHGPVAVKGA